MPARSFVLWFSQISAHDGPLVGDKGAHLGEMTRMGLPVPNGFVVTSQAYLDFLSQTGLDTKISHTLHGLAVDDSEALLKASRAVEDLITKAEWPEDLAQSITKAYHQLSSKEVFVAVRSSVVTDQPSQAQAIHTPTAKLHIIGARAVLTSIKETWANLFTARAILYRVDNHISHLSMAMAVPIQRMVEAESAGVVFSADPLTNSNSSVTIEAVWGLGEAIATGELVPDHYQVDKQTLDIMDKHVVKQEWQILKTTKHTQHQNEHGNARLPVSVEWQRKQKLQDRFIRELAELSIKLEQYFGEPQESEWAFADQTLFLTQTQPMTVLAAPRVELQPATVVPAASTTSFTASGPHKLPLLTGQATSPGSASGPVRIVHSEAGLSKVKLGDIVVAVELSGWTVSQLNEVAGIITDHGPNDDTALLAQELGIPIVTATGDASQMLKTGELVTIDGHNGRIYEGKVAILTPKPSSTQMSSISPEPAEHLATKTATKVYINAAEPEQADTLAAKNTDGVGLLRAEYILSKLGEHPQYLLARKKGEAYTDALYEGLMAYAKAFDPRPVIFRTSDFTTTNYLHLHGSDKFEVEESNPLLGFRGAARYVADPAPFRLEIQAVKRVRQYHKNLWVMLPFIRTPQELVQLKQIMAEEGVYRGGSFKLWMMAEVPANVILLDQFIGVGIDGVSVGTNDLCQLVLGVDRENNKVAALFDERNEAMLWCLEKLVKGAAKHGIMSSVCGQAPSVYPEITRKLVEWGVTSISISPEVLTTTREIVADAEFELVRSGGRST